MGVRPSESFNFTHPFLREAGMSMIGDDWVAVLGRVQGLTIVFVFAYFLSGSEFDSENLIRFKQILKLKRVLNLPMILTADFNKTPQEISDCQWPQLFQGFVLVPQTKLTCTIGTGRIIDFCLVSSELRGLVKVSVFRGPWKPHLGLVLEVLRKPGKVMVRKVWTPGPLLG